MAQATTCQSCGTSLQPGTKFCTTCGAAVATTPGGEVAPPPPPEGAQAPRPPAQSAPFDPAAGQASPAAPTPSSWQAPPGTPVPGGIEAGAAWSPTRVQPAQPGYVGGTPVGGMPPPLAQAAPSRAGSSRNTLAGLLVLLGAAVVAVGSFLTWVEVNRGAGVETGTGWETVNGEMGDGPLVVGVAVITAALGGVMLSGQRSMVIKLLALIASLAALGITIYELLDVSRAEFPANAGLGLWLMLGGSIAAVVGSLLGET